MTALRSVGSRALDVVAELEQARPLSMSDRLRECLSSLWSDPAPDLNALQRRVAAAIGHDLSSGSAWEALELRAAFQRQALRIGRYSPARGIAAVELVLDDHRDAHDGPTCPWVDGPCWCQLLNPDPNGPDGRIVLRRERARVQAIGGLLARGGQ